jgi:hypothetical protein
MGKLLGQVQVISIDPNISAASQKIGAMGTKTVQALQDKPG